MTSPATDGARGAIEVTMPETGSDEGAMLVAWLKAPGAEVAEDEPICVVRVGELTAEIVAPANGVVGGIYAEPGRRVKPGSSLAEILPLRQERPEPAPEVEPEPVPVAETPAAPPPRSADPLERLASEVEALGRAPASGDGPADGGSASPVIAEAQPEEPTASPAVAPAAAAAPASAAPEPARFRSPAVRALARTFGVDLDRVPGTGRDGRVTRDDVLMALARGDG